jgi:hypothetical protein
MVASGVCVCAKDEMKWCLRSWLIVPKSVWVAVLQKLAEERPEQYSIIQSLIGKSAPELWGKIPPEKCKREENLL